MTPSDYQSIPPVWRALVSEINGGRPPDGIAGIRDVDAECTAFAPAGVPFQRADGSGTCETDGHHLCVECTEISARALRRHRDRCEECGTKLDGIAGDLCRTCDP